ncbi:hypothetical protein G5I_03508 [Acromyrmex echinatior]|uniref:Uncharacterized protein n=1 Tax=Acromyrmex echinatior TaxID=103372 RepID=F4WD58_ACREC|nr:hypothetical protein G5I_03508 [Acromyrmex echinatior]
MKDKDDETHAVRTRAFSSSRYLLPSCDPVQIYFLANTQLPYLLTMANFIHVEWTLWTGESTVQCVRPSRVNFAIQTLLKKLFHIENDPIMFVVAGKREASQEAEAQQWMETVIGRRFPPAEVLIALKLSQELVIDRLSRWDSPNADSFPSRSLKSLGGQEFKIFNEPPPMTVILVVLRTRWRWPNDETTPTRIQSDFQINIDHNADNFAIQLIFRDTLCQDASRIVEAFDVIDSFKIELKRSRCNHTPLTAPRLFLTRPRHWNPDARAAGNNLMGISRYPTGLPNTDDSLLPEARQACLARSLSDGSRL